MEAEGGSEREEARATERLRPGDAPVLAPVLPVDGLEVVRAGPDVLDGPARRVRRREVVLFTKLFAPSVPSVFRVADETYDGECVP